MEDISSQAIGTGHLISSFQDAWSFTGEGDPSILPDSDKQYIGEASGEGLWQKGGTFLAAYSTSCPYPTQAVLCHQGWWV